MLLVIETWTRDLEDRSSMVILQCERKGKKFLTKGTAKCAQGIQYPRVSGLIEGVYQRWLSEKKFASFLFVRQIDRRRDRQNAEIFISRFISLEKLARRCRSILLYGPFIKPKNSFEEFLSIGTEIFLDIGYFPDVTRVIFGT